MQRRIKAQPLVDRYGSGYPAPAQRVIDMSVLNGGLNLWDLDYRLQPNQSPDLLNVFWHDGSLASRPGQEWLFNQAPVDDQGDPIPITNYGTFYACYSRVWSQDSDGDDLVIAHKGTKLYAISIKDGVHTQIYSGLTAQGGTFFVFGEKLYYFNSAEYLEITKTNTVSPVTPYIPVVVMNRQPDGAGGDLYQPENRIGAGKEVWFTADGTSTAYVLPYTNLDNNTVTAVVNGTSMTEGSGFTVDRINGVVTFNSAPTQTDPIVPNNVKIKCYKLDTDTYNSIMSCKYVTTYGTSDALAVVMGSPTAQPNAYFWSGSHSFLDPGYFPFDYYNLAGSADDPITGFGKQQSMLIIFKEHSIGKSTLSTQTISNRDYVNLAYIPVNDRIGCDVPNSIQLVRNNLVFANTYSGVYALLDTSSAGENNIKRLSRNVNGSENVGVTKGLLYDLSQAEYVSSYDDDQRYWLVVGGKTYLWDYTLASVAAKEENLSWFFFEGINARAWFHTPRGEYSPFNPDPLAPDTPTISTMGIFYFTKNGSISTFSRGFSDYGEAFPRKYAFAATYFGTYEVLKDVLKVVIAARSDTDSEIHITYKTDYEMREDLTPIRAWSWRLAPRNLSHRSLRPVPFAGTAIRTPRCFHVRHFQMILTNNTINTDMSVVYAQIIYRYNREDR